MAAAVRVEGRAVGVVVVQPHPRPPGRRLTWKQGHDSTGCAHCLHARPCELPVKAGKPGRVLVAALEAAPDALARRYWRATWRTREPAPAWRKPPAAARAGPVCATRERAASGHTLAVTSWRRRMHPLAGAALASRPPPPADPLAPCLPAARGGGGTGVGADGRGWRGVSGSHAHAAVFARSFLAG